MSVKIYDTIFKNVAIKKPKGANILPSIGFDANYIQSKEQVTDYISNTYGTPYFSDISNVIVDSETTSDGSSKSIRFTDITFLSIPVPDSNLYNKEFYIKTRMYRNSDDKIFNIYMMFDDDYNDRLQMGSGTRTDQNLDLWNNQANPRINYSSPLSGQWMVIEYYYNGNGNVKAYSNGTLLYDTNYTIQPYTIYYNDIQLRIDTDTWIDYYEIQIEGINWNNPTVGSGTV